MLLRIYEPHKYWVERGKGYKDNFAYSPEFYLQEQMFQEYMEGLGDFDHILEIGAGFGRITRFLPRFANRLTVIDISKHQIQNIPRSLYKNNEYNVPIEKIITDAYNLPFKEGFKFDLILAVEVFLHIPPTNILDLLYKLSKYSDQIIHIDPNPDPRFHYVPDYYNFLHNFEKIYRKLGLKVKVLKLKDKEINTRQFLYHACTSVS